MYTTWFNYTLNFEIISEHKNLLTTAQCTPNFNVMNILSSSMMVTSATGGGRSGGRGITRLGTVNVTINTSGFSGSLSSLIRTCPQASVSFGLNSTVPNPGWKSVVSRKNYNIILS